MSNLQIEIYIYWYQYLFIPALRVILTPWLPILFNSFSQSKQNKPVKTTTCATYFRGRLFANIAATKQKDPILRTKIITLFLVLFTGCLLSAEKADLTNAVTITQVNPLENDIQVSFANDESISNSLYLEQAGMMNISSVDINGAQNQLNLEQTGNNNLLEIEIKGSDNGTTHSSDPELTEGISVNQTGNSNSADISIVNSSNNNFIINQIGSENLASIVQENGKENIIMIEQGDGNTAIVEQFGSYNTVTVQQH